MSRITQYFSVGMSGDDAPYEEPGPALKKRRHVAACREETDPTTAEKGAFWSAVSGEDLEVVRGFCAARPELMLYWKQHEQDLQGGPLSKHAGLHKAGAAFKGGSLAVLFAFGFDLPADRLPLLLNDLFGRLTSWPTVQGLLDRINRRLEALVKAMPGNLERLLVAAARQRNYDVFTAFLPKAPRRCIFDLTPTRSAGDMTVLQAVAAWPDARIRASLLPDVLLRSSTAYVLSPCKPEYMEEAFAAGVPAHLVARNVLQELASCPDADALSQVLARLRTDGLLADSKDLLAEALGFSLRVQASRGVDGDALLAFAACQMQLVSVLDEAHLVRLRTRLHTLQANALRTRAAYSGEVDHPLYVAAAATLHTVARAMAMCTSVVRHTQTANAASILVMEAVGEAEEALFAERYRTHAALVDTAVDTRRELDKAQDTVRALEDAIRAHRTHLRTIQLQAQTIAKLRQRVMAGGVGDVDPVADGELERAEQELLEVLETRLLALQLPEAPAGECGLTKTASYNELDTRLLALVLPVAPSGPVLVGIENSM